MTTRIHDSRKNFRRLNLPPESSGAPALRFAPFMSSNIYAPERSLVLDGGWPRVSFTVQPNVKERTGIRRRPGHGDFQRLLAGLAGDRRGNAGYWRAIFGVPSGLRNFLQVLTRQNRGVKNVAYFFVGEHEFINPRHAYDLPEEIWIRHASGIVGERSHQRAAGAADFAGVHREEEHAFARGIEFIGLFA